MYSNTSTTLIDATGDELLPGHHHLCLKLLVSVVHCDSILCTSHNFWYNRPFVIYVCTTYVLLLYAYEC